MSHPWQPGGTAPPVSDAERALDALTRAALRPSETFTAAYYRVLGTAEGAALYRKTFHHRVPKWLFHETQN